MISRDSEIINMYIDGYLVKEISKALFFDEGKVLEEIIKYRVERVSNLIRDMEGNNLEVEIREYVIESINKILNKNDQNERRKINNIINLAEEGSTLELIGKTLSLSRERVRQIINFYSPEIIIAKNINKQKICGFCGERKFGVCDRGKYKMICRDCYKKEIKLGKKRWSRNYDKCIDCGTKKIPHHIGGRCRRCFGIYQYNYNLERKKSIKLSCKKWREKNIEKLNEINRKKGMERTKNMYNGGRAKALERDGYKCVICGISNEMNLKQYSKSLFVSHLGDKKDHGLENLITLCSACHNKKYSTSKRWKK